MGALEILFIIIIIIIITDKIDSFRWCTIGRGAKAGRDVTTYGRDVK